MKVKTLTSKNLQTVFGVTAMTIHNWRKGSKKVTALPSIPSDSRAVGFSVAAVKKWAATNGINMLVPPEVVVGEDRGKPGPKTNLRVVESK